MTDYMPLIHTGLAVDMALLDEVQAEINHGQTLARLKERGGVSACEALALVQKRKWRPVDMDIALDWLADRALGKPDASRFADLNFEIDDLNAQVARLRGMPNPLINQSLGPL